MMLYNFVTEKGLLYKVQKERRINFINTALSIKSYLVTEF
jgi:hypothetical protein